MKIDCEFVERILTRFIREELTKFGYAKGILGLSGGLDSTVCAYLATKALGPGNVISLIMPYKDNFPQDVDDAREVARRLKLDCRVIDISPQVDAYFQKNPTDSPVLRGNKMARERMSVLYDFSAREKALILGTSNKSELLIGYGTIHGDMACAINPVGDLYKTQMRMLAEYLKVPKNILEKKPTAGLWPGQTDEEEIGITYEDLDKILSQLVDLQKSREEVVAAGTDGRTVDKILDRIRNSEFKRKMPPIAKLSARSVGHDFLYPYDRNK